MWGLIYGPVCLLARSAYRNGKRPLSKQARNCNGNGNCNGDCRKLHGIRSPIAPGNWGRINCISYLGALLIMRLDPARTETTDPIQSNTIRCGLRRASCRPHKYALQHILSPVAGRVIHQRPLGRRNAPGSGSVAHITYSVRRCHFNDDTQWENQNRKEGKFEPRFYF